MKKLILLIGLGFLLVSCSSGGGGGGDSGGGGGGTTDNVPDAVNWFDFADTSMSQSISGISSSITLRFNTAYISGTPTVSYRINGGSWVNFTPSSPATTTVANSDAIEFKVGGSVGNSAYVYVYNMSSSVTLLDYAVGTVFACSGCPTFSLTGTLTYDWVPAKSAAEGGNRLDYSAKASKPVRRATIVAIQGSTEVATTTTNDSGQFTLNVPTGNTVKLRAKAQSEQTNYTADGIVPNNCSGASWSIRVADNVTGNSASDSNASLRPTHVADTASTFSSGQSGITMNIPLTWSGSAYTSRAAAPFALLDTAISELELVCQGAANTSFPGLTINWNENNSPSAGNKYNGAIGTSFYTTDASGPNLYILGQSGVDTDEYDDHVIAHEFGHYIENNIFRSDSIGGSHSSAQSLDPRVAFGEGFGNAVSGMVFNDPIYVDTSGSGQASGFQIDVSTAPSGDDRGIYSETLVQNFLYKMYDNRDGTTNSGSFDRIFNILRNFQRTTVAYTNVMTFASLYKSTFGATADGLKTLWVTTLGQPWDALCVGTCNDSGDTADLFDVNNDIGISYNANSRKYPQSTGSTFSAPFWMIYQPLTLGVASSTAHESINKGGYSTFYNKFGANRWYVYKATSSGTRNVAVTTTSAGCGSDYLDMYVSAMNGADRQFVGIDEGTGGCPSINFNAVNGTTYIIEVISVNGTALSSYSIRVN